MTTRRQSPGPSEYSTGYKPGEAHWRPGMSRSPTLSDSRYEHHSPRDRMYPSTMDIRQPLYAEFRAMLREHRRQEDEARDSLIKQIRDHREQQDDLLLKIAMLSPRTFDEGNAIDYRPSTSRREPTAFYSLPREIELDSALGSQFNSRSQYLPIREDSEETQDARPTIEAVMRPPNDDRARSKTAKPSIIHSDEEASDEEALDEETSRIDASRRELPKAEPGSAGRAGKRKRNEIVNSEAAPPKIWREMMPPPPKRKAAMYAAKKNHDTLKFYSQSQRQQSLALEEGRASAITTSCLCSQLTCKICGPLERIKQDSREQKWL